MIHSKTRTVSRKSREEIHYKLDKLRREKEQRIRRQKSKKRNAETKH